MDFLGYHIRQFRVGQHQSGKRPGGARLGYKTLIQPAKANVKDHLAELARIIRSGQNWPQEALIRQLNPKIRGWANYYRTWVCQATFNRLDHMIWVKLRRWASRRHPHTSLQWVHNRYWHRRDDRERFATPKTPEGQVWQTHHSEISSLFHAKVTGNRSPYDGDWVYWSRRRGHYPTVPTRVAKLLKRQSGHCAYCGLYFQHDDQVVVYPNSAVNSIPPPNRVKCPHLNICGSGSISLEPSTSSSIKTGRIDDVTRTKIGFY